MKSIVLVEDVLPGDVIEGRKVMATEPCTEKRGRKTIELLTRIHFSEQGLVSKTWKYDSWSFSRATKIQVERPLSVGRCTADDFLAAERIRAITEGRRFLARVEEILEEGDRTRQSRWAAAFSLLCLIDGQGEGIDAHNYIVFRQHDDGTISPVKFSHHDLGRDAETS